MLQTLGLIACLFATAAAAQTPKLPVPTHDQSAVGARGYFYVGGTYAGEPGKETLHGQMYVEVVAPKKLQRPYPLVLIHGAAQTATNWIDRKSTRLNSSHLGSSYAVFCLKKKTGLPPSCRAR